MGVKRCARANQGHLEPAGHSARSECKLRLARPARLAGAGLRLGVGGVAGMQLKLSLLLDRARGARGPLRGADDEGRGLTQGNLKQQTTRACPFLRVQPTEGNLWLGSLRTSLSGGKGAHYCPKWEVDASRCSIVGERAHSGAT
jgi:hypothetical protein